MKVFTSRYEKQFSWVILVLLQQFSKCGVEWFSFHCQRRVMKSLTTAVLLVNYFPVSVVFHKQHFLVCEHVLHSLAWVQE